jgi:PleD family two-component response regulator
MFRAFLASMEGGEGRMKLFAFFKPVGQNGRMTKPLALVFYERLLPGTQLVNRLQDLGYRATGVSTTDLLLAAAERDKPMIVFTDLNSSRFNVTDAIGQLRQNPATSHLPVIAFADEKNTALQSAARNSGATLVVSESAILTHLGPFLEQALALE